MTKAAYPLKLPNSIKQAAQRLAKEDGVSLNQWISSAVAQKVGSVETAAEFFKRRATRAKGGASLMHFLVNAPDVPEEGVARPRRRVAHPQNHLGRPIHAQHHRAWVGFKTFCSDIVCDIIFQ
jgi:hypothetical protein